MASHDLLPPIQRSRLTPLFSRAERPASNLIFSKMFENEAIEASRCNRLLCGGSRWNAPVVLFHV
jgi:hypothetical protein